MGQIRQERQSRVAGAVGPVPVRDAGTSEVRCTWCGASGPAAVMITADLREIRYDYCDDTCRDRHADAVGQQPVRCELCDVEAVGDTGRCAEHLTEDVESGRYPLAS